MIRSRQYNNPAIGAAFSNLASIFAPPSGSDLAGYANAAATRADARRRAEVYAAAQNPETAWDMLDRLSFGAGFQNGGQTLQAVDRNNARALQERGMMESGMDRRNAADNERALATNRLDNQRSVIADLFGPLNQGQIAPAVPAQLADIFGLPEIGERVGAPKPLSETEHNASVLAGMPLEQQRAVAFGSTPIEQIVMGDGPINVTRPEAIGQRPAAGPDETAATQRIERLTENLMATGSFVDPAEAHNIAVGIVDGRLKADRHPVTGELQVVDMATGRPAYEPARQSGGSGSSDATGAATDPVLDAIMGTDQFGQQYSRANEAFGVGGAAVGAVNTVGDALGVGAPYPEVQQTQADFRVLRESLLSDIADTYGRQPPSWLLQEIRALTPATGSVFEGPGTAQSKLTALGRSLTNELRVTEQSLQRQLSPQNQQELEARKSGLQAGIARVQAALASFGGQPGQQQGPQSTQGQQVEPDAEGWTTLPNGVRIREVQ